MLRLFTDFQAYDPPDEACFILSYNRKDVQESINDGSLTLNKGDRAILDAYEDFEVVGTLDFKYVKSLGREAWVAYPDWSTRAPNPNWSPKSAKKIE